MTTSGTTAWSMTAADIVRTAMGELATLDPGSEPEADELRDCLIRLNGMLNSWAMKGVSLYRQTDDAVTSVAATAAVTLPTDVRTIASARLVVSATQERPLWPIDRARYLSLPNKASVGQPTTYYLERGRDAAVMHLWPVSAAPVTIKLDYDRKPDTVTLGSQTVDVREELQETVYANLAVRIAGIFGQAPGPELASRAARLELDMFDAERPDSYFFEYDCA